MAGQCGVEAPAQRRAEILRLAGFLLCLMGYTPSMSVTHQKNSSKHFDNVAALRSLQLARQTLEIEAEAILALKSRLSDRPDDAFARAVALLLACTGRVVVSISRTNSVGVFTVLATGAIKAKGLLAMFTVYSKLSGVNFIRSLEITSAMA